MSTCHCHDDQSSDELEAERRFKNQQLNPDPVTALSKTPPPDPELGTLRQALELASGGMSSGSADWLADTRAEERLLDEKIAELRAATDPTGELQRKAQRKSAYYRQAGGHAGRREKKKKKEEA